MAPKSKTVGKGEPPRLDSLDSLIAAHDGFAALSSSMASSQTEWDTERLWLRAMIDQVPDYLFAKDTECRFIIANKAVAADLGHGDPSAILGKTDLELHPGRPGARVLSADMQVMRSGKPQLDHEEFVRLPDGSRRWLSTSKLPLRSGDGTIIGLVGIGRDITERKQVERPHPLPRLPRCPHRPAQPDAVRTAVAVGTGGGAAGARDHADPRRSRPLQACQRHARACGGRRTDPPGGGRLSALVGNRACGAGWAATSSACCSPMSATRKWRNPQRHDS